MSSYLRNQGTIDIAIPSDLVRVILACPEALDDILFEKLHMMSEGMQWFVQDVFNTPLGWLHTCSGPRGIVLAHGIGSGLISFAWRIRSLSSLDRNSQKILDLVEYN